MRFQRSSAARPLLFEPSPKWFAKFARNEWISDAKLRKVVKEAEQGNIDADYGGGVIKQRIARPHQGKSGGYRSIIYYRQADKAFFVYGWSKSARENIDEDEEKEFKRQAKITFALNDEQILKLLENGTWQEVNYHEES
ncbi:MAG: type II toxin-antitoxin system RelE/ParE family toxin [Acidobacteria bacterium]|nr:type II toxin-antitoxin system RelE/ParE family toxin [Acidobacteriota bacterium]MBI3424685.1 type II toxin-antitoxin system RelE/ParE family toxin [Acidobacteriota bacterium]